MLMSHPDSIIAAVDMSYELYQLNSKKVSTELVK